MSIKILPSSEIKQAAQSFQAPAILFSNPKNLYQRRIKRLKDLAQEHPLADYLLFAALVVESQLHLLETQPIAENQLDSISEILPLNAQKLKPSADWIRLCKALLADLKIKVEDNVLTAIENLEKMSDGELNMMAEHLLKQEFEQVDADKAVFIWAALSLYWLQLSQQIPHHSQLENAENLHHCPVCGSMPVASTVHLGSSQGLRYLHCSLCESEWNLVRAQCTNCNQHGKLEMWSLDEELALVRAEACGDCQSYLKIMFQEKDPNVEAVADDLASIFLDAEMEEKGFAKSALNPFLFPTQE